MSAPEIPLKRDFRTRAKTNDVPVADSKRKRLLMDELRSCWQLDHSTQIPWGHCMAEFFVTLPTPQWEWRSRAHLRQKNLLQRSN